MYKVIIVDDETWICRLIRKIVDWESLGFQVTDSVNDGLSALELIKESKPELVITDIRMPGLDGISLIKAVREEKVDVEFIIVSGYSDFEYARSALTFDAFAYILKPLDREEFVDILRRVKINIDNKKKIRSRLETSETVMLKNDMRQIIENIKKDISEEEINGLYGTKFGGGFYYSIIFKRDYITREKREQRENGEYDKFLAEIKEGNSARFKEIIYFPGKTVDQEIFIINTYSKEESDVTDAMKEAMKTFAGSSLAKSCHLTVCVGDRVPLLSEIDASYASAEEAMRARVCLGTDRVIDSKKESCRIANVKNVIDIRAKKKLGVLFDVLDMEEAVSEISRLLAEAEKGCAENLIIINLAAYDIIDMLYSSMQTKGITVKNGMSKQQALLHVDDLMTRSEIESFICSILKEFGGVYADEKQDSGEKLIKKIKRFISENYASDINLEDVAKMVCLSSTYVSEVFKGKTGENFSEYLIGYRIDIAKDFLKDIRYKVVDVSLMVGYKDPKYFSRLFKKKVGVNPSDYRKLCL
jgi:two-component system, response regulator YesN